MGKWKKKTEPKQYLVSYPSGADVPLALEILRSRGEIPDPRFLEKVWDSGYTSLVEFLGHEYDYEPEEREKIWLTEVFQAWRLDEEAGDAHEEAEVSLERAASMEIHDDEDYQEAARFLEDAKALAKEIEGHHRPDIQRWHEGHKHALDMMREYLEPVEEAIRIVKNKVGRYVKKKEEEKRRLAAEAARLERERRERERREAEKEAKEDAPEEPEPWTEEMEQKLQEEAAAREALEKVGDQPKTAVRTRTIYKWEPVDVAQADPKFLTWDRGKVTALVKSMGKDAEQVIGGIRVYEDTVVGVHS